MNIEELTTFWVEAWEDAYKARAYHYGKQPEEMHRRMMRARHRAEMAQERWMSVRAEPAQGKGVVG